MPTKLEQAREASLNFLRKDQEVLKNQKTLELIADRTDPDGNIEIKIGDVPVTLPASILVTALAPIKEAKEVELDLAADAVINDGK